MKNVKSLLDHSSSFNEVMSRQDKARIATPLRRENKYKSDAHVGRLERELEKTARNLQVELVAAQD